MTRAHPRSRGENSEGGTHARVLGGSSPLTRGKPRLNADRRAGGRLIPAHAGKTGHGVAVGVYETAHPRSRGENLSSLSRTRSSGGSSPLTREKLLRGGGPRVEAGLIPAHAGKTSRLTDRAAICAAHPRSRGENLMKTLDSARLSGSSPLTRGKPLEGLAGLLSGRLIPAHAGKTQQKAQTPSSRAAHPRSRGENSAPGCGRRYRRGSSPLTRGKRSHWSAQTKRYGLIPAHAGKTVPCTRLR